MNKIEIDDFKRQNNRFILDLIHHVDRDESGDYDLPLLTFQRLSQMPEIGHCFTTRMGGVSEGIYQSLNLSFTRGDDPVHVMANYNRVASFFGVKPDCIITSDQTHTTNVLRVGRDDAGNGVTRPRPYGDVDGLITNEPGVVLATFYADCVPLYFVDPVRKAIGLAHSGWRGTVARMGKVTVEAMQSAFGSNPEDIIAAIGPSICRDCYEVGEDVAKPFAEAFVGHEEEILSSLGADSSGKEKYQLDLWRSNEIVLQEAGLCQEHIVCGNICTCCNSSLFFSHRASQGQRGNLGAFLMLKK